VLPCQALAGAGRRQVLAFPARDNGPGVSSTTVCLEDVCARVIMLSTLAGSVCVCVYVCVVKHASEVPGGNWSGKRQFSRSTRCAALAQAGVGAWLHARPLCGGAGEVGRR